MGKIVVALLAILAVTSCGNDGAPAKKPAVLPSVYVPPPPSDFGDITNFNQCSAKPRRALSEQDKCAVRLLSQNCTAAADCLVTCTMSPDAENVGGGCYHVCFSPATGIKWSERPTIDFSECDKLAPPRGG